MSVSNEIGVVDLLNSMHYIVSHINNENAYAEWIETVPDEPSVYDFMDIAEDENLRNETWEEFCRLIRYYGRTGACVGTTLIGDRHGDKN